MGQTQEKRNIQRFRSGLSAWSRCGRSTFSRVTLLDLSRGGARIAMGALPADEMLVSLKLESGQFLTLSARKVWQRALAGGETYVAGLEFLPQDNSLNRRMLERWTHVQAGLSRVAA